MRKECPEMSSLTLSDTETPITDRVANSPWTGQSGSARSHRLVFNMKTRNDKLRLIPLTARAFGILRRLRQDTPDDECIFDSYEEEATTADGLFRASSCKSRDRQFPLP